MSDIAERATALAEAHPIGEVLENAFFGFFKLIGMGFGAVFRGVNWGLFHAYTLVFIVWLAFKDGFKQTSGLRVPPRGIEAPASKPPLTGMPPTPQQILDDPRYQDPQSTPFGVPYGPNVHASHD